jgi:hypothetical protein
MINLKSQLPNPNKIPNHKSQWEQEHVIFGPESYPPEGLPLGIGI